MSDPELNNNSLDNLAETKDAANEILTFQKTENDLKRSKEISDQIEMLEPNHPKMQRFQERLKAQLQSRNDLLKNEIAELKARIKNKQMEREELGEYMYERKQEISNQQQIIEGLNKTQTSITQMQQEVVSKVKDLRKQQSKATEELKYSRKKENELMSELRSLSLLKEHFEKWDTQMESELAVSQRISEKDMKEKKRLAKEKRDQDLIIYKIISEISKTEYQIKTLESDQIFKDSERAVLSQTVADANADLQTLNKEQHRLLKSWKGIIFNLQSRDKTFLLMQEELQKIKDEFATLNNEITTIEQHTSEEIQKNEKQTILLNTHKMEMNNFKYMINFENDKTESLEIKLSELFDMLKSTEYDVSRAAVACQKAIHEDKLVQNEIDTLLNKKTAIQRQILNEIQEYMAYDKTAKHLKEIIVNAREQVQNKESTLVNTENRLAQENLKIEKQRSVNARNHQHLEDTEKEDVEQKKEVENIESNLRKAKYEVNKKQALVESLSRKMDTLVSKVGRDNISPQELKIVSLKKVIEEMDENSKKLQQLWLRKQGHIVIMSDQRNNQLYEIDILRKQILILDQKNLKIEYSIEEEKTQELKINRSIKTLYNKIAELNSKLSERRFKTISLDKDNAFVLNNYTDTLRNAESESANLENDIKNIERDKEELGKKLLDVQREHLAWQKKEQMLSETKVRLQKEKDKEGEIGTTKSEIHRMKVYYSKLSKSQEKLIKELEYCVIQRDEILKQAEAREKRYVTGKDMTKYGFEKKVEDLKNNIKEKNKELKTVEHRIEELDKLKDLKTKCYSDKQQDLETLEVQLQERDKRIDEDNFAKKLNLERLILYQNRIKMYEDVKKCRYKLLYKNEKDIERDNENQTVIYNRLIFILNSLMLEFPTLHTKLKGILDQLIN